MSQDRTSGTDGTDEMSR
ncbi:hypothetical protein PENSTE_c009G08508 [Penicillium steckii]|uniref:Uncharacterized protein n=1 Tax=Penicillium steckii TaxID=303698 RepID=A0A1V6T961_9EURO|nr:hypothetical protein PENSTE_c009G08508 [Penicillium steckii]